MSTTSAELWPALTSPADLHNVEAIPLAVRGVPTSGYAALERAAALWADRLAVTALPGGTTLEQSRRWTYGELLADVCRCANALTELGAERSTAIGLLSPNTGELVTALLAAETTGIAVPLNPRMSPGHLTELMTRAGVEILIAAGPEFDAAAWRATCEVASSTGVQTVLALRPVVTSPSAPDLGTWSGLTVDYLETVAGRQVDDHLVATPPTADDLAAFFHTGGTTGLPKLAAHRHGAQMADAWMIASGDQLDDVAVVFAALPLFHVNALMVTILAQVLRGRHVVWAGPLGYRDPELLTGFWSLVEQLRISAMSAVPTVYAALSRIPVTSDIRSLRLAIVGASPLPPAVRESFRAATGIELSEGYGLTEATCASTRSFLEHPRPGWVGQRLPYQQARVVRRDDGRTVDVPHGEVGTLLLKGPNIFAGYLVGRDHARPRLDYLGTVSDDDWLDTGDLARMDAQGFIQVCGRAKDLIIRGGHNIDPAQIEDALLAHPDVTAAAAVGSPDTHAGEVPVAYVTVRRNSGASPEDLQEWCRDRVAEPAASPRHVVIVDDLPITDVGKPNKVALRADAIRAVAGTALRDNGIQASVSGVVVDGIPTAVIERGDSGPLDDRAIAAVLRGFSFAWKTCPDDLPN